MKVTNRHAPIEHLKPLMQRTIEIAARVRHPVLVPVLDSGFNKEGQFFLTMPLLKGQQFETSSIPTVEKVRLTRDLANAAHAVHEAGFHRFDIKQGNLMIETPPDQPPVVSWFDLDLAISVHDEFDEGALAGTPIVMAPEQFMGQRGDRRIDVYALGATLYHVISGRPAISGSDLRDIMTKCIDGEVTPLRSIVPSVDNELDAIVTRCLQKNPNDRYQTASHVAQALTSYLSRASRIDLEATLRS
jgi:serine/threonine-protein kinase